MKNLLIPVVC